MLRIRLLGRFELDLGEGVLLLDSARAESLLAYLALHRDAPQPRQRLAAAFWPESTEGQARTNLRHVLHLLRSRVPEVERHVEITVRTIRWRPDAPIWLDVDAFEDAFESERFGDAVDLYDGDLLDGSDDDWLLGFRDRLRRQFLDALQGLAKRAEQDGDVRAAVAATERLLRADPLREEAYRHLIRLLDAAGDRPRALAAFHECASLLERELGVAPSAATTAAYEAVLSRSPGRQSAPIAGPPLVARTAERAQLVAAWKDAEAGSARFVLISGEPGVGKTRIAEDLRAWCARRGAVVAEARCYAAEGPLAYGAVVSWLRSPAVRPRLARLDRGRRSELARILPELRVAAELEQPAQLPYAEQRLRLFDAIAAVLAHNEPTLVVLDDLQYADAETCGFLHYLLRSDPAARLLVVATARREELGDGHPGRALLAGLATRDGVDLLEVGPLDQAATAHLARAVAGEPLPDSRAAKLHAETGGNPLFVVESVRAGWQPGQPPGPRVQAVIEARLDRLPAPARALVEVAATIGSAFTPEVLADASDLDEDALVGALDELWRRRLLREDDHRYDFTHDRIREVAAARVTPARRRQLHGRIASALERAGAASAAIAAHHERAGAAAHAVASYRRAAEEAHLLHAHVEAVDQLERALRLVRDDRIELALRTEVLAPLAALEGYASPRTAGHQRRAGELSRSLGVVPEPPLLRSLALTALSASDFAGAEVIGRELREAAGDDVVAVEAAYVLGVAAFWQADFVAAREQFELVAARYRPEHHRVHLLRYGQDAKVVCLSRLANTLWFLGAADDALAARDAALAWAEEVQHPLSREHGLIFAALLALDMGDEASLRRVVGALRGDFEQAPARLGASALSGYLAVLDGDARSGLRLVQAAMREAKANESAPGLSAILGRILLASQRAAGDAAGTVAAAEDLLASGGAARVWAPEARRVLAAHG